jgi:hypothetical protein
MKAEELRIGNYYNKNGEIEQITPNDIIEVWESERIWCKPIPLTEEWLLKFGFKKVEGWDDMFYFEIGNFQVYEYNVSGFEFNDFDIKHVHQLQNLYYALTNEELTIK